MSAAVYSVGHEYKLKRPIYCTSDLKILSKKPLKSPLPEVVNNNVVPEEPTHNIGFGFEEEELDLESLFQNFAAKFEAVVRK